MFCSFVPLGNTKNLDISSVGKDRKSDGEGKGVDMGRGRSSRSIKSKDKWQECR